MVGVDTAPPTPFRELRASTRQISSTRCEGKTCTSSSCSDEGVIELEFTPPEDDRSAPSQLGYRVLWHGAVPAGVTSLSDDVQPLGELHTIVLAVGFANVSQLDGELALVAVDRAGNESEPSAPVHVTWSGCMSYFDAPERCVQHSQSCTIALPGAGRDARCLPLMAAAVASLFFCRRQRRVSRRRSL
jgi:hypothetical protein